MLFTNSVIHVLLQTYASCDVHMRSAHSQNIIRDIAEIMPRAANLITEANDELSPPAGVVARH